MLFWRICRQVHVKDAFTGEGARLYGGRWNSAGVSVVYTSTSLALAAIETFVHLEPNLQPDDLVSIACELPDDVALARIEMSSLPAGWRASLESLRTIGDEWVHAAKSVGLRVPSAALRGEWNVLLNPAHRDFRRVRVQPSEEFQFDLRMFRAE